MRGAADDRVDQALQSERAAMQAQLAEARARSDAQRDVVAAAQQELADAKSKLAFAEVCTASCPLCRRVLRTFSVYVVGVSRSCDSKLAALDRHQVAIQCAQVFSTAFVTTY